MGTVHSMIVIREIDTASGMRDVEELQKRVWGVPDLDVVPLSQLVAAKAAGGVLLGAFDGRSLVGFAYGFVGIEAGQMAHHSHMLAVDPSYRGSNVGYRLKLAQRNCVLEQGISEMTWTFDPLQSLNAYFNFGRLGVVSDRYLINFYGEDAASFLHRNGTDRLWVSWHLASRRVEQRIARVAPEISFDNAEVLVRVGHRNAPEVIASAQNTAAGLIAIEVPQDINQLEKESPQLASDWRLATRTAFREAFAADYLAADFIRGPQMGRYILSREVDPQKAGA